MISIAVLSVAGATLCMSLLSMVRWLMNDERRWLFALGTALAACGVIVWLLASNNGTGLVEVLPGAAAEAPPLVVSTPLLALCMLVASGFVSFGSLKPEVYRKVGTVPLGIFTRRAR